MNNIHLSLFDDNWVSFNKKLEVLKDKMLELVSQEGQSGLEAFEIGRQLGNFETKIWSMALQNFAACDEILDQILEEDVQPPASAYIRSLQWRIASILPPDPTEKPFYPGSTFELSDPKISSDKELGRSAISSPQPNTDDGYTDAVAKPSDKTKRGKKLYPGNNAEIAAVIVVPIDGAEQSLTDIHSQRGKNFMIIDANEVAFIRQIRRTDLSRNEISIIKNMLDDDETLFGPTLS